MAESHLGRRAYLEFLLVIACLSFRPCLLWLYMNWFYIQRRGWSGIVQMYLLLHEHHFSLAVSEQGCAGKLFDIFFSMWGPQRSWGVTESGTSRSREGWEERRKPPYFRRKSFKEKEECWHTVSDTETTMLARDLESWITCGMYWTYWEIYKYCCPMRNSFPLYIVNNISGLHVLTSSFLIPHCILSTITPKGIFKYTRRYKIGNVILPYETIHPNGFGYSYQMMLHHIVSLYKTKCSSRIITIQYSNYF